MSKTPTLYNVWTDGSYNDNRQRGGIGWVIELGEDHREGQSSFPELPPQIRPHGSNYAELLAVATAFKEIPAGSDVHLRLDAQNVIDWLKGKKLTCKPTTKLVLSNIFDQALTAVNQMGAIEYTKASDRNNVNMARAHTLSREGAALKL